ncbi:hypothetical protein TWF718_002908 [Orbilia javanica]|uniref:Uncharacterized protein n=1 Tax=Orbilia javanica TaxID=47235 RepID=A0AAN8RBN3_9PEZI
MQYNWKPKDISVISLDIYQIFMCREPSRLYPGSKIFPNDIQRPEDSLSTSQPTNILIGKYAKLPRLKYDENERIRQELARQQKSDDGDY